MQNDWPHIFWLSCAFLFLFGTAEFLYRVLKVKSELSRKLVHLLTGVLTLLFPVFLVSHWSVLILCASFALILLLSLHFGWLPSINAIDRHSRGSLLYPLSVYLVFLFFQFRQYQLMCFYLPVLVLAVCDPVAALVGKKMPFGCFRIAGGNKTIAGCLAFLVTCFALTLFLFVQLENISRANGSFLWSCAGIAAAAMLAEALSGNGWDNLTIPLAVMGTMFLLEA